MASDAEVQEESTPNSPDDSGDQEMADHESAGHTKVAEDDDETGERKKANSKDPSRPRRKKARRACFACQRAHLTCGDERPCQRCIKRGLQDACQDGVRKKAKYLHDAPNEALLPGAGEHYQYLRNVQAQQQSPPSTSFSMPQSMSDAFGSRTVSSSIPMYNQSSTASQLPLTNALMDSTGYGPQQSADANQFQDGTSLPTSMNNMVRGVNNVGDAGNTGDFGGNIFDNSDLSQYNFDPASFNFGNHYGALEFGMLGHMATGAAETPPSDHTASLGRADSIMSTTGAMSSYVDSPIGPGYIFGQDQAMSDWRTPTQPQSNLRTRPAASFSMNGMQQEQPNAFSIGTNSSFASPTSEMSPAKNLEELSSKMLFGQASTPNSRPATRQGRQTANAIHKLQQVQQNMSPSFAQTSRRRGDPSQVYRTVTQPYSYTTGFHSLTAFLQRRFSSQQTLRIAKSLASIRPSFLACTKSLGYEDLIFMEKCFQRTLWEYEDFISATGTPTIVCRRTGEVAAVGKEFSILTGWKKDILLGREANLNINRGTSTANNTNATSTPSRGTGTPRLPEGVIEAPNRPQPVFLAELLDDESTIEFYEDFARLAFGDSHGTITTRCKLLKYRTKDTALSTAAEEATKSSGKRKRAAGGAGGASGSGSGARKEDIAGEARIDELGDKDGKVECSCCWTVKRDLFDLPMMIVMNFLPCI